MFHSIRGRLVLSYVLLTLLTVGLVGVLALSLLRRTIRQQEIEQLSTNAEAMASQAALLLWPEVRQRELQDLAQTSSFLGNARVRILGRDSAVLADSAADTEGRDGIWLVVPRRLSAEDLPPLLLEYWSKQRLASPSFREQQARLLEQLPPETALTILRWERRGWANGLRLQVVEGPEQLSQLVAEQEAVPRSGHVVTVPVRGGAGVVGYVEISQAPDLSREALATARRAFTLAAVGATLLAIVVGLVVSQGLAAPLRELSKVAGRMSGGDLSSRAPVHGKDEIGQLAGQFNQMAERLESSFTALGAERDALRHFIADASHELRTPITALRSFNELLQGAAAGDPAAQAEFLAESQVQLDRLEWVTRHLLDLSRLEAGLVALDLADHEAADLLEASLSAFKSRAQEKGISLSVQPPQPGLQVYGDRARLELALANLVDNALKFTPEGGRVELGAEPVAAGVRLWVRDTGPGIDPEDKPRLFERFYRGRNAHAEGSGIGLAIVHSVAQAHGGRAWVESEPGSGSLFLVELPSPGP